MASLPAARVKKIQEMLNAIVKPRPPLAVDGIIGEKTTAALSSLQAMAGLKKTGAVDSETAAVIARAIKTGKIEKEQPTHYVKIDGKWVGLTERQYNQQKSKIVRELQRGPLFKMKQNAEAAEYEWNYFNDMNKDQWFVSFCIETTRGVSLPNKSMITKAMKAYKTCEAQLKAGDLKKFYGSFPKAEIVVNDAVDQMRNYRSQMIEGGGNWVTGLTYTKTASFTFVGVFAAPAAGATLGTGVVASAVIGGAGTAIVQSGAQEIGNFAADKAGWTPGGAILNVVIDGGIGAILGYFTKGGSGGKHVVETTVAKLAAQIGKKVGFSLLKNETLRKIALFMVTEGFKKALEDAIKDVGKAVKGDKKMTVEKFTDNLVENFLKGIAFAPIGKIIENVAKGGAKYLAEKDRKRIWDLALGEVAKQAGGKTIHIGEIDKRTQALVEKIINDEIAKSLEPTMDAIFKSWKGELTKAAFEKEVQKKMLTPAMEKKIHKEAVKIVAKSVKAKA